MEIRDRHSAAGHANTNQAHAQLTAHEAARRSLEDAGAFEALWVGAGGADTSLQCARHQPVGQPVELAVAQEAVALDDTEGTTTGAR